MGKDDFDLGEFLQNDDESPLHIPENETKASAELRKTKEEAIEAKRLKDKIVSLVSHDLANLQQGISGYIDILKGENLSTDASKKIIEVLSNSSSESSNLIKAITKIGHIKRGDIQPKQTFLNTKSVVERALKSYLDISIKKKVSLLLDIPLQGRIFADEILLVEVIQNMVAHAIESSEEGDTVKIYVQENEPSTIRVTNASDKTGIDMPAGLSLARDIIEAHHGELIAGSGDTNGNQLLAKFPDRKPNVLTIDDNELIRKMLIEYVIKLDANVTEVESGEEALGILQEIDGDSPIDLVLLDLTLPGISGLEVLRRIKYHPETTKMPVIVVTGDESVETREEIFRMNADDIIIKPFNDKDVMPRLRRFLG